MGYFTAMIKLLGIMDEDPFDYRTWSGSSKYFFNALNEHRVLVDAISAKAGKFSQRFSQLQSFHPDMEKWKFKYHLNINLFESMSEAARLKIKALNSDYNSIIQVGAWYDLIDPSIINVSYHDGNLATRLASPFGYPDISKSYINKALDYETRLYKRLNLIFPMSQWLANSFVKDFGADENKVIPVGAGINLPVILDTTGRSYGSKRILMVGKDFTRKGGEILLAAFAKVKKSIPDAELRLIGPSLNNLPEGVSCTGFLKKNNPEDLQKLLKEYFDARVFVIPSLYEPFGISFVEAMAHRLPCIGTNICAMPEIIEDGRTGFLVEPGDQYMLANRLIELLDSEDQCKEMGCAGYDHYEKNYTWDVVVSKIIDVIESYH